MTKNIDLYTKAILTVIAACLVYIVVKDISIVPAAHAQQRIITDVNIASVGGDRLYGYTLPVKVAEGTVDVYVEGGTVDVSGTVDIETRWQPLKVVIADGYGYTPPVKVEEGADDYIPTWDEAEDIPAKQKRLVPEAQSLKMQLPEGFVLDEPPKTGKPGEKYQQPKPKQKGTGIRFLDE